jgi:hypothetical protein
MHRTFSPEVLNKARQRDLGRRLRCIEIEHPSAGAHPRVRAQLLGLAKEYDDASERVRFMRDCGETRTNWPTWCPG